jgi:hypothetical protein
MTEDICKIIDSFIENHANDTEKCITKEAAYAYVNQEVARRIELLVNPISVKPRFSFNNLKEQW